MALSLEVEEALKNFLRQSDFTTNGGVVTDLDGTAVHEEKGRIYIPESVEFGLKAIYNAGRPVILNSLRFPLSVMRTFGKGMDCHLKRADSGRFDERQSTRLCDKRRKR